MPPLRNSAIPRPRIEMVLREALAAPLALLQAPLGSGKSTLIASVLGEQDDAAYFAAQPWHRENFIEDLVASIRGARPDFGRRTLGAASAGASAATVARSFIADLGNVPSPLTICVDNAEQFADDSEFATFIEVLVENLPESVHVLLAGRSLPPIPIATLHVAGRAVLIPADSMAFSEEELIRAIAAYGGSADDATIDRLRIETQGWAAAVALALQSESNVALSTQELALQYLSEELVSKLPADVLEFLENVAVFERIEPSILSADATYGDVEARCAQLQRAGAPIARASAAYVIHPLVRRLAATRLERSKGTGAANARAARAYARAGNLSAALFHLRQSRDAQVTDELLREHGASLVRTGDNRSLRSVIELLSSPQSDDVRAYIEALLEKVAGGDRVDALLDVAAQSLDPAIAFAARSERIERSIARTGGAGADALADIQERAAALGPQARAQATLFSAWALAVQGKFGDALATLEHVRRVDDPSARFNSGILYAYAQAARGEATAALDELDSLVRLFENDDRVVFQTLTLVWQARLALLFGLTTIAGDAARAALHLVETLSIQAEEAALYSALTEIAAHEGSIEQTLAYADRLRASAPRAWYAADGPRARAFAEISLARAAFLGHDVTTARDLASRAARNDRFPLAQRALAAAESSAYGSLLGDPGARDASLGALRSIADAKPFDAADAVTIATALDLVDFLDAISGWSLALPNVASLDPFRSLVDARRGLVTTSHAALALINLRMGSATREPFNAAIAQLSRNGDTFEARLLGAFVPREATRVTTTPSAIDLTARETEILALLVDGLSNKEIAQRLFLSPRTVETHVERVLGKLEVGSRSRAIAKALRLGIVALAEQ